jgi:hypothetical protein
MADQELSPGVIVGGLIDTLGEDLPTTGQRRWRVEDHIALSHVALLDRALSDGRVVGRYPAGPNSGLDQELEAFHSALPFAEVERGLIVDKYDELVFPSGLRDDVISRVPRQQLCIAGIVRATSGRELMNRWWSWRRGIDQYEGAAGLKAARVSIASVYHRLGSA